MITTQGPEREVATKQQIGVFMHIGIMVIMAGALSIGLAIAVVLFSISSTEEVTTTKSVSVCGDVNGDGSVNVSDTSYLIAYLFRGGSAPVPAGSGDVNGDGDTSMADLTYLIAYLFRGGSAPICASPQTYDSCDDVSLTVLDGRTCRPTTCGTYLTDDNSYYLLTSDITVPKTACVIKSSNTVFDLNGHTITYGTATAPIVPNGGFEGGLTGWNISGAPTTVVADGTYLQPVSVYEGSKSLQIGLPASSPQMVELTPTIPLKADTTYALTAMVRNLFPGSTPSDDPEHPFTGDHITVSVSIPGLADAFKTGKTWTGFQLVYAIFRPTTDVDATIRITVTGEGMPIPGTIHVDDIAIRPAQSYGIGIPSYANSSFPDVDWSLMPNGDPHDIVIKNGTIAQGAGHGFSSHNLYFRESVKRVEVADINATVHGPQSSNISGAFTNSHTIHDNTFISNVTVIGNRHNFDGAQLFFDRSYGNQVYNNSILNGPHSGLVISDNSTDSVGGSQVYGNLFRMKSRYTNGFAIAGGDRNALVHDNTILNVNGYYGRGIHGGNGAHFYNNYIEVSDIPNNQEYDGCQSPGVYGFQVEEGEGTEVTGNTIIARTGPGLCDAIGLRFTTPFDNIAVRSNSVSVIDGDLTDDKRVYGASFAKGDNDPGDMSPVLIANNSFTSNSSWLDIGKVMHLRLLNNTFTLDPSLGTETDGFVPLWGINGSTDTLIRNPIFGNALAGSLLRTASITWRGQLQKETDFADQYEYAPTVTDSSGQPIAGATVTLLYDDSPVYSGTTGSDGKLTTTAWMTDFTNVGGVITEYVSYVVRITKDGFVIYEGAVTPTSAQSGPIVLTSM